MSLINRLLLLSLSSLALSVQAGNWNVPSEAKKLNNPISVNEQSAAKAKNIFDARCVVCHGKTGLGDGTQMKVDYSLQSVLLTETLPEGGLLTDGELYWKVTHGIGKMPAYAGILTDEERWLMVNHMRSLPL